LALVFALPSSSGDWVVTGNEVVSNKVIIRNKIGYQTVKPPIRS
jgi:short subunit fatty acids transporter